MTDKAIAEPRGTSPGGLPYPEDTDAVMAGAQAIKALAQAVDNTPPWPWFSFVKWTNYTQGGGGSDQVVTVWDIQETNVPTALEANAGGLGGFVCPRAGLWQVNASGAILVAWPSGNSLISIGVKTASVPPAELFDQHYEPGTGNNRRSMTVSGFLRIALGEWCRMIVVNNTGNTATLGGAVQTPPGDRYSLRFSARWVAP